jgi:hypothetical protein
VKGIQEESADSGKSKAAIEEVIVSQDGKTKITLSNEPQKNANSSVDLSKEILPFLVIPPFLAFAIKKNLGLRKQFPKQILLNPVTKEIGIIRYNMIGSGKKFYKAEELELRVVQDKKGRSMKNLYVREKLAEPMLIGASGTWIDRPLFELLVEEVKSMKDASQ